MRHFLLVLMLACQPTSTPEVEVSELVPLPAPELLRRVSLDLRGVLPTAEELEWAESDPAAIAELSEEWMESEAFEERLVHLLAQRWQTRVDVFDITHQDFDLHQEQDYTYHRAVGEEPLRLMASVIVEDRPWREILTSETTRIHDVLADHWPVDYPEGETGWQEAYYTDDRPPVGVLATNGLWWRYSTTESNMNRGRAAAISRLLLCEDYLNRPISFGEDGFDDPEEAVRTSPYCLACHSSIDPVAASLFGFWWLAQYSTIEEITYHPEREPLAETLLGTSPSWYGQPMSGLADLGAMVANDPRFTSCAVESWAELLWQRDLRLEDQPVLEALRVTFLEADQRIQPLLLAILETEAYQAGSLVDDASEDAQDSARTRRMLSPDQLTTTLDSLAGFSWEKDGYELLDSDIYGYRILAGGLDGLTVTAPSRSPGLTWALVTKRAAQGTASLAVDQALVQGQETGLLEGLDLEDLPGDPAFESALDALHWQLFGQRSDANWRASITDLWSQVEALEGAQSAWTTVLTVTLRDPEFLSY